MVRRLGVVLVFGALLLATRELLVEPYLVVSDSMEETFVDGDVVLVDKRGFEHRLLPWTGSRPPPVRRGETVLYEVPGDSSEIRIKRIVGLPGDTLEMRAGVLVRNGRRPAEPYARSATEVARRLHAPLAWHDAYRLRSIGGGVTDGQAPLGPDDWGPIVLPEGRYFVLGDNRERSIDSRHLGPVSEENLIGRPFFIAFSYGRRTASRIPWIQAVRTARIGPAHDR